MELRQLRYFLAIAECGNISRAAERVFVAQSALSHQLAQLEDELGTPLFHRSRRGVALTEAGERFLPHARAILRQTEEAANAARSTVLAPTGKVVFGIPHSASLALALPLLREVRQHLPRVELELTEELTGTLSQQLRSGQIQLAALFDDGTLDGLEAKPILSERLSLIEPADVEPVGDGQRIGLREALAVPLILPAQPHGVRPIIEAAARAAGLPPPRVAADISSVSILRTTLLAGLGRTLLPVMPLLPDIEAGRLRATPVDDPPLERVIVLCAAAHIPQSAACAAVAARAAALMHRLCVQGQWRDARPLPPWAATKMEAFVPASDDRRTRKR